MPTAASQALSPATRASITATGARNISVREAQTARGGDYKPVNTAIPTDENQAMTMLSGQWSYLSKTPSAVNDVAMDLTNKFGREKAQQMLNTLDQGGTSLTSPLSLSSGAAQPGYGGGLGKPLRWAYGMEDAAKTGDLMNRAYGSLSDQYNYLATQSPRQAAQFRGSQYNRLIQAFSTASPDQAGTDVTGNFQQATAKALFGMDIDDLSAQSTSLRKGGGLMSYLQGAFGKYGYLGTDQDRREAALSQYGIRNRDLTGDEAAAAVYKKIYQAPAGEAGDSQSAANQIKDATKELFGTGGILNLSVVKRALTTQAENPVAQYQAVQDITNQVSASGMPINRQIKYLNQISNLAQGDPSMGATLVQTGLSNILQNAQTSQTFMGRGAQFGQQTRDLPGDDDRRDGADHSGTAGAGEAGLHPAGGRAVPVRQADAADAGPVRDPAGSGPGRLRPPADLPAARLQPAALARGVRLQPGPDQATADYHRSVTTRQLRVQPAAEAPGAGLQPPDPGAGQADGHERLRHLQAGPGGAHLLGGVADLQRPRPAGPDAAAGDEPEEAAREGMTDDTIQQLKLTDPAQAQQAARPGGYETTLGQIKTEQRRSGERSGSRPPRTWSRTRPTWTTPSGCVLPQGPAAALERPQPVDEVGARRLHAADEAAEGRTST